MENRYNGGNKSTKGLESHRKGKREEGCNNVGTFLTIFTVDESLRIIG